MPTQRPNIDSDATSPERSDGCLLPRWLAGAAIETPAFVYEEAAVVNIVSRLARLRDDVGCKVLYTLKPLSLTGVLSLMTPQIDGLAASSLCEARLARDILGDRGTVHITTPGFRPDEIKSLAELCDYVAFNSLSQWSRFRGRLAGDARCGVRLNPELSLVDDARYDPCRAHSKLGVPMHQLLAAAGDDPSLLDGLTGLHFHTNCDSGDFSPLLQTVRHVDAHLADVLKRLTWLNLGGGYLYGSIADDACFREAMALLRDKYDLEIFIEPGAAVARRAGCIVASVIDLFDSGGKTIAVLDTSVNHMPEVFEYQFSPNIANASADGSHRYLLAGCTCLAGDLFGDYAFDQPLKVGDPVVFTDMGAYSTVKWHWFNGVRLPSIYAVTQDGNVLLKKRFTYEEFLTHCGDHSDASA